MFCPKCGAEYREGFTFCASCEVDLVDELPLREEPEFTHLVTVYEGGNPAVLVFAKSILESEGIEYYCKGEGIQDLFGVGRFGTGFNPVIGSVKIQVAEENAAKAKELLDHIEESEIEQAEAEDESDDVGEPDKPEESESPEQPEQQPENQEPVTKTHGWTGFLVGFTVALILAGTVFFHYMYNQPRSKHRQVAVETEDRNKDGKPDAFFYYEKGVLVRAEQDRNFDGKIDDWCYYKGGVVDRCNSDEGFNGKINQRQSFRNGILSRAEIDTNNYGTPEIVELYSHGVIAEKRWYHESTGKCWKKALYKNGLLREEYIDEDCNGTFDRLIKYNAAERPVEAK
ncbi:MAG: DUF2007 domain-containing protein [Thermodesulfobacteriota bacterium]